MILHHSPVETTTSIVVALWGHLARSMQPGQESGGAGVEPKCKEGVYTAPPCGISLPWSCEILAYAYCHAISTLASIYTCTAKLYLNCTIHYKFAGVIDSSSRPFFALRSNDS
uniref:Uncharacterized protein n=1 Tax=Dicentrarchus labrax TaxID=13489 RepID=A0A8C4E158_DICLA